MPPAAAAGRQAGSSSSSSQQQQEVRLDNINTTKDATVHQDLTYTRYADGMISSVTSVKAMESWSYVYDDLNRLLSATNVDTPSLTQSFNYDDVGNMTYNSKIGTYTYPTPGTAQPHAVQTAGSRSYAYDAVGRMTSRNGTVIQWNGDGKPKSIGSVAFTYGGTGERLKKVSGSAVTRYVGGDYEIASDGTVTKYLRGGKQVGTSFFINHSDHLGSIQAVTDATGVEVRRQDHTPFGDQHYAWGSHQESKGWIGEREEETELVYLNARYYDPEIGRFTAPDPIRNLGQRLNRYTYSLNSPVNFLDPTGLDSEPENNSWYVHGYGCSAASLHPDCFSLPAPYPEPDPIWVQPSGQVVSYFRGLPLNAYVSDGGQDLARLEEEDAERIADHQRLLDNTLFANQGADTTGTEGGGDGSGGGGSGGGGGGGGGGDDIGGATENSGNDSEQPWWKPDVGVISTSGSVFFLPVLGPIAFGGGGGQDWIKFPNGEVTKYGQGHLGFGSLGFGASLEGGFGYNIFAPKDYRGGFWHIQIALTPPFSFSLSGSGLGPITGNPWTFTGGPYVGIPGASITYQEFGYETIPIPDP